MKDVPGILRPRYPIWFFNSTLNTQNSTLPLRLGPTPMDNQITEALKQDSHQRENKWTESIAVGSKAFVEQTKVQLQSRAKGRKIEGYEDAYELHDREVLYHFTPKNSTLSPENGYFWDYNAEISGT